MPDPEHVLHLLAVVILAAPAALVFILGTLAVFDAPPPERVTTRLVQGAIAVSFLAGVSAAGLMAWLGIGRSSVLLADWVVLGHDYHFVLKVVLDRLSLTFALLSLVLCGTIGSFATRYMHKDVGFYRFFLLYAMFLLGMTVASLADTIETLFFGWELVGLSSALLIGFFHEREAPVRNALWVWVIYRVADAALLLAAVALHHLTGEGDFDRLLGTEPWPGGVVTLDPWSRGLVGVLLLLAAAGKSGMIPFSGWLPRAMEGPTPSSAVFYGALSVHLGAFLLLRLSPLLAASPLLSGLTVAMGLSTALFATLVVRAQTDIKTVLAFASVAQVGLIVAEIGLGFRWLPLIHIVGHACLRTWQFVRAPTILQDLQGLENAVGERLNGAKAGGQFWWYRMALERGWLDDFLWNAVARPSLWLFERLERLDRWWTTLLGGQR